MAKKQSKSIIDEGMIITGNVSCAGALEVNGQIQGQLHCRNLTVSQPGHIHGDVFCESVDIDSRIDGSIRSKQVILRSKAQVNGDIYHSSLSIESGAFFEGDVRRSENPTQVQSTAPQMEQTQIPPQSRPPEQSQQPQPRSEPNRPAAPDQQMPVDPIQWSRTG